MVNLISIALVDCGEPCPATPKFLEISQKVSVDHIRVGMRWKIVKKIKASFHIYHQNDLYQSGCWVLWSLISLEGINGCIQIFSQIFITQRKDKFDNNVLSGCG